MPLESPDAADQPWSPTERSVPGRLWDMARRSPVPLVCGAAFGLALLSSHFEIAFLPFNEINFVDNFSFALQHCSLYVIGIWALLGPGGCVLRSTAAIATIVSAFGAEAALRLSIESMTIKALLSHVLEHCKGFQVLEVVALCVALATLRLLGLRLYMSRQPNLVPNANARWQFRIRGMLVIMLLWSALFASASYWPMTDMLMMFGEIASVVLVVSNLWPLLVFIAICSRPPLALASLAAAGVLLVVEVMIFVQLLLKYARDVTDPFGQSEVRYLGLSILSYLVSVACIIVGAAASLRWLGYRIEPFAGGESIDSDARSSGGDTNSSA